MEVYDQEGRSLDDYDLDKGYLKEEIKIIHHDEILRIPEEGHYETIREYPNGGKDQEWVIDVPGEDGQPAWDERKNIFVYIPYTPEELEKREKEKKEREKENELAVARIEVEAALISAQINTLSVDDATALRWKLIYPEWTVGMKYETGFKVKKNDRLYKCLQENVSQPGWEPENVPALWTEINETHSGDITDPIPYNNNMVLENGKYYIQDGVKYRCTRDTGIPIYSPLKDLVGIYVEAAK